ncbi:FBX42-like protein [Mya arenaria]|uniref:FBX42-like protein n=1 Tax=Mya arenaria TaxID=6604 RepID=A0ABY7EZA8_MYAAR|nr:FBX42-like protein [Mya arenaria]
METSEQSCEISDSSGTITDLPEEILEFIFMKLSPYKDLKSASLVCTLWHRLVSVVQRKLKSYYEQCVFTSNLEWSVIRPEPGTYPFPKACATMVVYKDSLILFGGWSHPTPFPLHQAARFFSELHVYKPSLNRWTHLTTLSHQSPQPLAGHSASVVRDTMVVFGGSQVPGVRINELWMFDFKTSEWRFQRVKGRLPEPRYGHTQVTLDDSHVLILGGKGGGTGQVIPNVVFKDCWLLTIGDNSECKWEEVSVENEDQGPPQLWCHSACKIGNMIVTVCRPSKVPESLTKPQRSPKISVKQKNVWIPPREDQINPPANQNSENTSEEDMDQSGASGCPRDDASSNENPLFENLNSADQSEQSSDSLNQIRENGNTTFNIRPGLPSVRPNAMKNRQKQLEALLKYEKKFRHSENSGPSANLNEQKPSMSQTPSSNQNKPTKSVNPASLMVLHVLDISKVLETKTVQWQKLNFDHLAGSSPETLFYSLVEGRGEILMFGGIEKDIHSLQRGFGIKSHTVRSSLYVLSPVKQLLL